MRVSIESPDQPAVIALIAELDAYQDLLYPPEARYALDLAALCLTNVLFVVARHDDGHAIGCGAVVLNDGRGEVKRMYVQPAFRGRGAADLIIHALESAARGKNCKLLLLETGPFQAEALNFYTRHGFERRGPFGDYPDHPLSVFMSKRIESCDTP